MYIYISYIYIYILYMYICIFFKCRLHKVCAPNLGLHHHETIIKNLDRFRTTNLTNSNTIHYTLSYISYIYYKLYIYHTSMIVDEHFKVVTERTSKISKPENVLLLPQHLSQRRADARKGEVVVEETCRKRKSSIYVYEIFTQNPG